MIDTTALIKLDENHEPVFENRTQKRQHDFLKSITSHARSTSFENQYPAIPEIVSWLTLYFQPSPGHKCGNDN